LQKWLETDPDNPVARHYYSACIGNEIPDRASDAYIRETFDKFASSFDEVLSKLDYKAPELVLQAVLRIFPQGNGELSILDAGCGTGLCGALLKPYAKRLIGVDLSSAMIYKAKGRQVYNELIEADLVTYLQLQHQSRFDLIISADTLCYFGDLKPFFQAASRCLKAGGYLIFTLEKIESAGYTDYQLNHHGRFSHDKDYVGKALDSCDFNWVNYETVVLRQESGVQVIGLLVTAKMKKVTTYSH
jgi:predicted TPR repeat methyltransferase